MTFQTQNGGFGLFDTEKLSPEKLMLVPDDGIILRETELDFSDGDTVFDVLSIN